MNNAFHNRIMELKSHILKTMKWNMEIFLGDLEDPTP